MPTILHKVLRIVLISLAVVVVCISATSLSFFLWTKSIIDNETVSKKTVDTESTETFERFPVSVNTEEGVINENPLVDWYVETHLSIDINDSNKGRLLDRVLAQVAKWDWYQNLASAVSRVLVIYPGQRKEEIVKDFGDILKWSTEERELFSNYIIEADPFLEEGKFYPGRYVVSADATPENVADVLYEKFSSEILIRYDDEVEKLVPLADALIIASLLEREAYDFNDMRYISGIIWNRLFIEMPLQLDASLQYARGSKKSERLWWPKVVPKDKYIDSPYNTYENAGLPPAPIANPSVEAIVAALNPRVTDCMFYFHDSKGGFYCTKTYEEHVAKLKEIYGRGK